MEFEVEDIAIPQIPDGGLLLRVEACGLCGTDLNSYRGLLALITYPRIPGHEVSGIIVEKGENVPDSINIGDQVMVSPYTNCGICSACRFSAAEG